MTASGIPSVLFADTSIAALVGFASGVSQTAAGGVEYIDAGGGVLDAAAIVLDVMDLADLGRATTVMVGTGIDGALRGDNAGAAGIMSGAGSDVAQYSDAAGAELIAISAGQDEREVEDTAGALSALFGSGVVVIDSYRTISEWHIWTVYPICPIHPDHDHWHALQLVTVWHAEPAMLVWSAVPVASQMTTYPLETTWTRRVLDA
jgi:hypothetical protein